MDAHKFTRQPEEVLANNVCPKAEGKFLLAQDRKGVLMAEFMQLKTITKPQVYFGTLKEYIGPLRTKGVEC